MTSSKTWSMAAEADEESYFQASDEEEIGPKVPVSASISPHKRKRAQSGALTPPPKRPAAPSPGRMAAGNSAALGLDYDDGSDSEGSSGAQSPVVKPTPGGSPISAQGQASGRGTTPPKELAEDLGDVAMKMRAKRLREEEEEEGFAGLLAKQSKKAEGQSTLGNGPASRSRSRPASPGGKEEKPNGVGWLEKKKKEPLIKLNFGRKAAGADK